MKTNNVLPRQATIALLASFAFVMTLSVTPVTFASSPTPNGFVGACNMLQAWPGISTGVPVGGGMQNAMTVDNANGNAGMWTAVAASGDGATSC
jgi:hypothetical protein